MDKTLYLKFRKNLAKWRPIYGILFFNIIALDKEEEVMLKSVEAIVESDGEVRLKEPIHLDSPCRAIVTILDEKAEEVSETALLSEAFLSEDWSRPEEDEAWSHLQKDR